MRLPEALSEAHRIAFYPMMFQAIRSMIKFGILSIVCGNKGIGRDEIVQASGLSDYAVGLLFDIAVLGNL